MREFGHERAELFAGFVRHKRSLGYVYPEQTVDLVAQMASFLQQRPCPWVVDESAAKAFAMRREGESASTQRKRASIIRQFALYLREIGVECHVPGAAQARSAPSDFLPRIISEEEMAGILRAAASWPGGREPGDARSHVTMIALLWCCGLRLGEALGLTVGDVDLEAATITVRRAKYGGARLLPVSGSLIELLRARIAELPADDGAAYLFPGSKGGRITRHCAAARIRKTMLAAGVTKSDGKPPRVHDIRHSYAVAALGKMDEMGVEARRALPLLCAYMGHSDIKSTEYYLRLTEASHPLVHQKMAGSYAALYPMEGDRDE